MRRLLPLLALLGCTATVPQAPPSAAPETAEPAGIFAHDEAVVLRLEDRREFDRAVAEQWASHPNALYRQRIALALGRIGTADFEDDNGNGQLDPGETMAGVRVLSKLASDPESTVRRTVAFALGEIGDPAGIDSLLALAADPQHADVAAEAVEALGKSAAAVTLARYQPFTAPQQREAVRARAIRYLFRFDSDDAMAVAGAALADADPTIKREAAYALSRRAHAPSRGKLELLLTDPDTLTRTYSARALGRIAAPESFAALMARTTDQHPWVRVEVSRALAAILTKAPDLARGPRAVSDAPRIMALTEDPDAGSRAVAIETLGYYAVSNPTARQRLEEIATTGTRWQRELAAVTLATRIGWETIDPALADAPLGLKRALINASGPYAPIRERYAADADVTVRAAAVGGVPDEASPEEIEIVKQAMSDDDVGVRSNAIDRFSVQKSVPAAERLAAMLSAERRARSEAHDDARLAAIAGIAAIDFTSLTDEERAALRASEGFESAEAFLRSLLKDGDPVVRRAAAEALTQTFKLPRQRYTPLPVDRPIEEYVQIVQWSRQHHTASIHMPRGVIHLTLFSQDAPMTAWNFAQLAQKGYFDGTSFMRVVPNFVVQAGDPRNDQTGGPGYAIRDEINLQKYTRGAVGMALAAPDAGGSQHFITHSPQPHLDGGYTIFARVIDGMESVVDQIERGDRVDRITIDQPATPARAEQAEVQPAS